jgi:hypothetical protein
VPKAKEPCPFIDHEKKMCLIHAARFLSCATFPETALAVRPYGIDVKNRQLEYMRSRGISCVDGVKMSGPRREYVERLGEALYEEVAFTGQVLDSAIADEDLRFARSSDDVRRYFENSGMKEKALAVIKGMDDPDSRGELYQKVLPFLKKYAMLDIGDFAGEEEASVGSRDRSSSSGQWQVGEPDLYDAQGATFLLSDLIYTQLHSDRMYTIQYDASRLSPSQADVIREYVKLLRKRSSNPANIALRPFSSARGSQKSLISAYCSGENFSGEGHVIVPQEEIEKYLLRITGMLNMALAVSNVPDNLAKEDLDRYMPVISYIRGQYTAILGEELVMPDNPEGILKAIRRITLGLPKSMRMEPSRIEEYNRLAKEALAAA